jgi:hypothetical protein
MQERLSAQQIMIIVNRWIGVSGGYLGDFSYRTHADFYPEYCNLDFDPYAYEGTTRERFIEIISNAAPGDQAKIVRGVLERFPLGAETAPATRTPELRDRLLEAAARIEGSPAVQSPNLKIAGDVVTRAISDAETLLANTGATSSVDRIHTALHGFLIAACEQQGIAYSSDPSLPKLFKLLREKHPGLSDMGPRSNDVARTLGSLASAIDALQPIRNRASVAHPNPVLLDRPEALLVINSARTILTYLDEKLGSRS